MPERIHKLQPDRTLALRGFDDLGASAAIHSATSDSFIVSGCFRDPADFAVLTLYDVDNFYEHPRLKYLPDTNFAGLTLQFDVRYSGLMQLDSPKYWTIDWPFLDVLRPDNTKAQIRLYDADSALSNAVRVGGSRVSAECSFTIVDEGLKEYDRLTLWYGNLAFDYIVPKVETSFLFEGKGAGTSHTVRVSGTPFSYVEQAGDTHTAVALGVIAALASCPAVTATQDSISPNQVNLRARRDDGVGFDVSVNTSSVLLYGISAGAVANELASQINGTRWATSGALIPLRAERSGSTLRLIAQTPGEDGNMLSMYALAKNSRLRTTSETAQFTGGSSDAIWRVTLPFSQLGIPDIRMMWLTFSPALANGAAYTSTEWEATFTNWRVTGPDAVRSLQVAGPGSMRIEEDDSWCKYSGTWVNQTNDVGFFSSGYAKKAGAGAAAQVKYSCGAVHDLYVGAAFGVGGGMVSVSLDGDAATQLNTAPAGYDPPVNTRRLVRSRVPAGEHLVNMTVVSGNFTFDFIEAAVPSDVPDALPPNSQLSPALDYSTDHTYKLPPARIHWIFDRLGFAAPMNEYIGVFWWNQRKRAGAVVPEAKVTFTGTFAAGEAIFLKFGTDLPGSPALQFGKTVFPADTNASIARHFAQFLNGSSVGAWAKAEGDQLIVTSRSPRPAYRIPLTVRREPASGSTGAWTITGSLEQAEIGQWVVDPEQDPPLNRGAVAWHKDMFRECARRNRDIVMAMSMELVNPPQGWGAVYLNNAVVETHVGFGQLKSTHCHFGSDMRNYQGRVYTCLAELMHAEGLTPELQFGEFLWWFFTNKIAEQPNGGMAFYDPETRAAAQAQLGRPLHGFQTPVDDPLVNAGADAQFLRNRLRDHVTGLITQIRAARPEARFEVLFPYDVNHPEPAGVHQLGGRLNRKINLPVEWESKTAAGFDRMKTEALDFGAWSRNLDLARTAIRLPLELGWPRDSVRHLVPVFRPGYPWEKEVELARGEGIPVVNLWAWDHVCLYNLAVTPKAVGRSFYMP